MKRKARMIRRWGVVFVALGLIVGLEGGTLSVAAQGNNTAEAQMFLIAFGDSTDLELGEEYGGEVWSGYPLASAVYAWMTPEAAEALAEHEAVKCVDQRQLFLIGFEESVDLALVGGYGGEVYAQSNIRPGVWAFMTMEVAEALGEHPAVRYVEPDVPVHPCAQTVP